MWVLPGQQQRLLLLLDRVLDSLHSAPSLRHARKVLPNLSKCRFSSGLCPIFERGGASYRRGWMILHRQRYKWTVPQFAAIIEEISVATLDGEGGVCAYHSTKGLF